MKALRLLMGMCVLFTLLGCSGMLMVTVHNLGTGPAEVSFRFREDGKTPTRVTVQVPEGGQAEEALWYRQPTGEVVVEARWNDLVRQRSYTAAEVDEILRRPHAGRSLDLAIGPRGFRWVDPNAMYNLTAKIALVGIVVLALVVWQIGRRSNGVPPTLRR